MFLVLFSVMYFQVQEIKFVLDYSVQRYQITEVVLNSEVLVTLDQRGFLIMQVSDLRVVTVHMNHNSLVAKQILCAS